MSWRERMQSASFKGVSFYVESSVTTDGRRVPVRKLAGMDGAVLQDLGQDPSELDITAYLFGPDYDLDRDDLVRALTSPGAGALVHPYRGDLWVRIVRGPQVFESQDEGGYCSLRFSAVVEDRAGLAKIKAVKSTASSLGKAAKLLRAAATVDFAKYFNVLSMPSKYLQGVTNAISNVTANLRSINGKLATSLNGLEDISAALDDLDNAVNETIHMPTALANRLMAVVRSVVGLADHTEDTIDAVTGLPTAVAAAGSTIALSQSVRSTRQASLAGLGSSTADPATAGTTLAAREAESTRAVYRVSRAEALARSVETYAVAYFDSSALALEVLNQVNAEIDALSAFSPSDDLYFALQDVRAALVEHLTTEAADLPRVQQITRYPALPSLLLAHELYGDVSHEPELVARNHPRHPLFMEGLIEYTVDPDSEAA